MAVNEQAARFGRVSAKSQDRFDVPLLGQQNVSIRLDRVVKAQGRAKVRIERLERGRIRPFRVKDRQNMGDPTALVADEFVKSADSEVEEGGRLHGLGP